MNRKIGVITIGQAPRKDLFPEVERFFPEDTTFTQRGVLDQNDEHELEMLKPKSGDTTLVSRLVDGTYVTMARDRINPKIQELIDQFNRDDIDLIVLACTGEFEIFHSYIPVIYPDHLLGHVVRGLFKNNGKLGIIVPLKEQIESVAKKWRSAGFDVVIKSCSPYVYDEQKLIRVAQSFKSMVINAIVLDCIGYNQHMKEIVEKHSGKKVILSRNLVFKIISEL